MQRCVRLRANRFYVTLAAPQGQTDLLVLLDRTHQRAPSLLDVGERSTA